MATATNAAAPSGSEVCDDGVLLLQLRSVLVLALFKESSTTGTNASYYSSE